MRTGEASLLRVYVNADDRFSGRPLFEAIVARAHGMGLAGASVFAAEAGYGGHRTVHDLLSEYSSSAAPMIVEIVDWPDRIALLLEAMREMVGEGIATVSAVRVARGGDPAEPDRSEADAH